MAEVNETIGGYKLRSLLQTGQTSQVFEVIEPTSYRHFAMKVLLPEHSNNNSHRKTLFNEAEIGVKMRHENVINILKVNRAPKDPHFIMEFFPSGSLRNRLLSKDPKDKEFLRVNARKIFRQMATGLAYMNANGYVHCDVKPDNTLVNALGQTKIIDFAISKHVKGGFFAKLLHRKKKPQGTPSYMSPEQIRDEILDGQADVYSYGATLYELTTGRPPFRGNSLADLLAKHIAEKPQTPIAHNKDLTDEFSAIIFKMLAKKKADRYGGFHEVLIDLKKTRIFRSFDDREEENQ